MRGSVVPVQKPVLCDENFNTLPTIKSVKEAVNEASRARVEEEFRSLVSPLVTPHRTEEERATEELQSESPILSGVPSSNDEIKPSTDNLAVQAGEDEGVTIYRAYLTLPSKPIR